MRGEFGYINNLGDADDNTTLPLYDRFFLGGINSLRGFKWATVGPEEGGYQIGGTTYGLATVELLFPLVESIGMRGVFFFDAGNAYLEHVGFQMSTIFAPMQAPVSVGIHLWGRCGSNGATIWIQNREKTSINFSFQQERFSKE